MRWMGLVLLAGTISAATLACTADTGYAEGGYYQQPYVVPQTYAVPAYTPTEYYVYRDHYYYYHPEARGYVMVHDRPHFRPEDHVVINRVNRLPPPPRQAVIAGHREGPGRDGHR